MAIQQKLWTVDVKPKELVSSELPSEDFLENMIIEQPEILSSDWMIIGKQVRTKYNKYIDLLAIAPDGEIIIVELKKNKSPREIVAQGIDYASCVQDWSAEKIRETYTDFAKKFSRNIDFDVAYKDYFSAKESLPDEEINSKHRIVLVAAKFDDSSERIVEYLAKFKVEISVLVFQVFAYGQQKLLSRTWLVDSEDDYINGDDNWNQEYYISFGHTAEGRRWEDALRYNFISGGGKRWYSKTLEQLKPNDFFWVNIPGEGYVACGKVLEEAVPIHEFKVKDETGNIISFINADKLGHYAIGDSLEDSINCEYFVRVEWINARQIENAFKEVGLFGNQNTACKPKTNKWIHTTNRLKQKFNLG